MNSLQITEIVNLVSQIAKGEATIAINIFCENAESAAHNTKLVEKWKYELVGLLETLKAKE